MRTLQTLAAILLVALASTSVRADELPKDWQFVRGCLAKVGFVYNEHYRVVASIEYLSGDYDALNAAFKRCREQLLKEVAELDTTKKR